MSDGALNFVSMDAVNKTDQRNRKRSFLITVDDNGKIEVNPKDETLKETCNFQQKKSNLKIKKASRTGKQRIRIALIEENADSSEEDQEVAEDKNDVLSLDAQSFEAMHDRFIRIYNKNLHGKPSFVVLEDALVRKRIEDTLQDHYSRTTCHCHAQQQTSSCDIGAHTGSQTDEFLLQYALRSQIKGHSRGCQATDVNIGSPQANNSKRNLQVPSLRRLNQVHHSNQSEATATSNTTAPHVTISFVPPNAATVPAVVQPQQQPLQQQLLLPATSQSQVHCCSSHCACGNCNNCCLQLPANSSSCAACFLKSQQQHPQQQHLGISSNYVNNCHSNCCLLRPSLAQATLGYCMPGHCSQQMLLVPETSTQQQRLDYSISNWPTQSYNPCHYYPMPTCNMAAFGVPHCASCHMPQAQQQLQQQHVSQTDSSNMDNSFATSHPLNPTTTEPQSKSGLSKMKESNKLEQPKELGNSVSQKINKKERSKATPSKLYMARFGRTCLILKPNVSSMPPRLHTKPISRTTSDMALSQK
ncbi:uncharacterized protein LOC117787019 [Drosophila innubila]|uniref:uncharacterized protein LOC117787019 n=1 Tax=Drosophila innubila TaxID=198719 RepID=UPI00148BC26C|nr:uncharacterized protein LOC117787019 [Drosophila innubila]